MATNWPVYVLGGKKWHVASMLHGLRGEVLIPLDQIDGMSDAQIGAAVRTCSSQAELAAATVIADFYVMNGGARFDDERFPDEHNLLLRCSGENDLVDEALSLIDAQLSREKRRREKESIKEKKTGPGYVYLLKSGPYYKIGRTNNLDRRILEIGIQMPHPLVCIMTGRVPDMVQAEKYLHEKFAGKRINGEWFDLSDEDVGFIKAVYKD